MQAFTKLTGIAAPLPVANIDTDKIIPARHLKTIKRTGLGVHLFETLRYHDDGRERAEFVLNRQPYRKAEILIAGENFGCGSSREHAPWALLDFGIRCVIAPSFADIFFHNCFKNGVLPITLEPDQIELLLREADEAANPVFTVDLEQQHVQRPIGNELLAFEVDAFRKHCLLNGLDDVGLTMKKGHHIDTFESRQRAAHPWLHLGGGVMAAIRNTGVLGKVLLLPGDGIGPEVMREVRRVMDWFGRRLGLEFELDEGRVGGTSYDHHGTPLTDEVMAKALEADAVLFGAVGGPRYDSLPFEVKPERGLLRLRKEMELFANLRPAKVFGALVDSSSLKPELVQGLDLMILRELTGGIYFGEPRGIETLPDGSRRGVNTQVYTTAEIVRVARVGFELARKRTAKLCSVEKANVMESGVLWREEVQRLRDAEYGDVELSHMYADNCAMQLVRAPKQFDVILADNLFGDILSDCAAMLTGSLGMLPSASLGAEDAQGKRKALYEPVHGSAPDIAGSGQANPIAMLQSFSMMLRYSFDQDEAADLLDDAIGRVLAGGLRTADIMQPGKAKVSTSVMGESIVRELDKAAS